MRRRTLVTLLLSTAAATLAAACRDSTAPLSVPTSPSRMVADCDPTMDVCDGGGGGGTTTTTPGLVVPGRTPQSCFSWSRTLDIDRDGVDDGCEYDLAYAFRPMLVQNADCIADTHYPPWRLGGDYDFAVERRVMNPGHLRIAYMMAYYWDCGRLTDSPIPVPEHAGDSEFILVDVAYNASSGRWESQKIFLSAHCGTTWGTGYCEWFDADAFPEWIDYVPRGAPWVYVSYKKHANYRDRDACKRTYPTYLIDNCLTGPMHVRWPMDYGQAQNAGSWRHPFPWRPGPQQGQGCVNPLYPSDLPPFTSDGGLVTLGPGPVQNVFECFWDRSTSVAFRGWTLDNTGPAATGYGQLMNSFAKWNFTPEVVSVSVSPNPVYVQVGGSTPIGVSMQGASGPTQGIDTVFRTTDASIATTRAATVVGVREGTVQLVATSEGIDGVGTVNVYPGLSASGPSYVSSGPATATATLNGSDGRSHYLRWEIQRCSADPGVGCSGGWSYLAEGWNVTAATARLDASTISLTFRVTLLTGPGGTALTSAQWTVSGDGVAPPPSDPPPSDPPGCTDPTQLSCNAMQRTHGRPGIPVESPPTVGARPRHP